jgi:hypothetical protein
MYETSNLCWGSIYIAITTKLQYYIIQLSILQGSDYIPNYVMGRVIMTQLMTVLESGWVTATNSMQRLNFPCWSPIASGCILRVYNIKEEQSTKREFKSRLFLIYSWQIVIIHAHLPIMITCAMKYISLLLCTMNINNDE